MKSMLVSAFSAFALLFSQNFANAGDTTVSDIKNPNLICFHVSKSEALVFKTSAPQRVWKTLQDREGKIKTYKALQLGLAKIDVDADLKEYNSFKANVTEGYQLSGLFENQTDGEVALAVTSTFLPNSEKSNITDNYNCSRAQN